MRHRCIFILLSLIFGISLQTLGQAKKFVSDTGRDLTLNRLTISPLVDNVSGIYAPAATSALTDALEQTHQWTLVPYAKDLKSTPEDFEGNPESVKAALKKVGADGLIAGRISQGPKGITVKLSLYVGAQGLPVGSVELGEFPGFEIKDINTQVGALAIQLMHKMPYHATVLSRKGQLVTFGLGTAAGIRPGVELTALQVIRVNRHPKFNFILGTENLVLGKVRVEKSDEYLSFGSVASERDPGVIGVGTKLSWDEFVNYPAFAKTADGKFITDAGATSDAPVALGDHAQEWKPQAPPTFGSAGLLVGLGSYALNSGLATGSISGTSSAVPSIHFAGEMWINPHWFADLRLDTYIFSVNNGLSGSSPGTLNVSATETSLAGGYNFLLNDEFFGPKIKLEFGYSVLTMHVDASTPTAFESNTYSGGFLGLGGEFPEPITDWHYPLFFGGRLRYYISPSLSETPTTSGSSSTSQMSSFAVYAHHRTSEHFNIRGELTFDSFSTSFSGSGSSATPSSSSSQTITSFLAGVEYMF